MSRINIALFLILSLMIPISSILIINMKTKDRFYIGKLKEYENLTIRVNNEIVKFNRSLHYFDCQSDNGDVEIIFGKDIIDVRNMFNMANVYVYLDAILSIKIKSLNTYVTDVSYMFQYQRALTFVDLSEFDMSKVTNFKYIFGYCNNLFSIKFGNYIVNNPISMANMFYECYTLTSLNLSNFNISSAIDMSYMFKECRLLTSLNINLKEANVNDTTEMFSGCNSLTSLDLKNFKTSKILKMNKMFYFCVNLKSLDLSNFDTSLTTNMESMFDGCKSLIYLNINNFNTAKLTNMKNMFQNCFSLISLNLSNFKISNNTNIENIFYGISENLIYCVNDDLYQNIKTEMNSKKCAIRDNNCATGWSINTKKIINDNDIVTCYDNCNETINYKYEYENKCYSSCPTGTTSLYNNNFLCEIFNEKEFEEYINNNNNSENINNTAQIIHDIKTKNIINNITQFCSPNDFFKHECKPIKYNSMLNLIIDNLNEGIMNDVIDDIIKNKIDYYNTDDKFQYQITSSFNQKNKIYDNISVIDLKECENKLKDVYNIPKNNSLIIFKYDYNSEENLIPIVGYEVFNPITSKKLDLSHCKNIKIDVIIPANIKEDELYKHDPKSNYYKDKCSPYHNEKGVDMTLYDRKKEYNDNNLGLCSENCEYINYNNESKKVLCQCEPQFNSSLLTFDKIINKKKLLNNFIDIKKSTNIGVIKCFKKFMSLSELKSNIGSYIIISIVLIYIFGLTSFICKGYSSLISKLGNIITKYKKQDKSKNILINNPPKLKNFILNTEKKIKKRKIKSQKNPNNTSFTSQFNLKNKTNMKSNKKQKNLKIKDKTVKFSESIKYSDSELNIFDYSEAIKNDKRNYTQIYISYLKTRHPLISSFNSYDEINSIPIKICFLFFTFALNLFVNSLFFTDDTMHKIKEDEGIFNFVYNLPITIYSTIISFVIMSIINKLTISEKILLVLKKEENLENSEQKFKNLKRNLTIKFVLFFVISFILLIMFWFYLGCFCTVYKNTQIYLIKDTLISFAFSLIIPFGKYLLACLIRKKSLNEPGQCLYKISQLLQ